MNKKVLLVEDEPTLAAELELFLKLEGFDVKWISAKQEAQESFATGAYDLVLLDIGLSDGSGLDLCKEFRQADSRVPILFLSTESDEDTLVRGLELGGNDFIKKTFSAKELLARLRVLLRANSWQAQVEVGGVTLNPERREAYFKGAPLELNRRQFEILSYFLARPDQIITREQLLNYQGLGGLVFDRTVDSHVSQLRKSMKSVGITTLQIAPVYGVGYRLEVHQESRPGPVNNFDNNTILGT